MILISKYNTTARLSHSYLKTKSHFYGLDLNYMSVNFLNCSQRRLSTSFLTICTLTKAFVEIGFGGTKPQIS